MVDKPPIIDAEFRVKNEPKTNFFHSPSSSSQHAKYKHKNIKDKLRVAGKHTLKATKLVGRATSKVARGTIKAGAAVERKSKEAYVGGYETVKEHRKRVLEKKFYQQRRLELDAARYQAKQLLPSKQQLRTEKGPGPLSDKAVKYSSRHKSNGFFAGIGPKKPKNKGGFFS